MACLMVLVSQLQDGAISALSSLQNIVAGRVLNLINLGKTACLLEQKMKGLTDLRDDLVSLVEVAQIQPRMRCTKQVEGWLGKVESLKTRVDAFRRSFEGRRIFVEACSFESVYSNYVLGQEAADLLGEVNELKEERDGLGNNLVMVAPPDAVVAVPGSAARIVGAKRTLKEIQSYIEDEKVGVIGIWGMGGVGKTTLLKKVNHYFLSEAQSRVFDTVIFVTVSKDVNDLKIQQDIGVRLGFSRDGLPSDDADRRCTLYEALRKKRFMLLLDDIWAELDLEKIGIPNPTVETKCKCKVIFTTREKGLCGKMEAQKTVEVVCLDEQASWKLFRSKVGEKVDLSDGSPLCSPAKKIARRCGGLPLALVTLGRAMAGAKTAPEWEDAIEKLKESSHGVEDMEKKVFFILKFSYDRLKDYNVRECFLYCCLFPEDDEISTERLIDYWIGEGFLNITEHQSSLDRARRMGRDVIAELKAACLLESVGFKWDSDQEYVRMHDVVRDMALWLRNGDGENDLFLVHSVGEEGSALVNKFERWEMAKRISVIPDGENYNYDQLDLPERAPKCHNLQTLLISGVRINQLCTSTRDEFFFQFMPALRVLDLSWSHISQLPKEIGLLRGLRYLNLSHSDLESLPKELGNLTELKLLDLSFSGELRDVPNGAILRLTQLQMLNLYGCEDIVWRQYPGDEEDRDEYDEEDRAISLRGINCHLKRLEEFRVYLKTIPDLMELAGCDKLSKCTRFLLLEGLGQPGFDSTDVYSALQRLQGLRKLSIRGLIYENGLDELKLISDENQLQQLESLSFHSLPQTTRMVPPSTHQRRCLRKLSDINMYECHGFRDLTWIQHLPCLGVLRLCCCDELEELLGGDEDEISSDDVSFPRLRKLHLLGLPKLKSISRHALLLPSLEELHVVDCPQLTRLPFGAGSAKKLKVISGEQEWFDRLEWDHGVKDTFLPYFRARH